MATRRVRTGAGYVADPGGGKAIWEVTYEDQEITGAYVADPGGGKMIWESTTDGASVALDGITDESGESITDESGGSIVDE